MVGEELAAMPSEDGGPDFRSDFIFSLNEIS